MEDLGLTVPNPKLWLQSLTLAEEIPILYKKHCSLTKSPTSWMETVLAFRIVRLHDIVPHGIPQPTEGAAWKAGGESGERGEVWLLFQGVPTS